MFILYLPLLMRFFSFHNFHVSHCGLFSLTEVPLTFLIKLVRYELFSFHLSVTLLILHQIWLKASLTKVFLVVLGCGFSLLSLYLGWATPYWPTEFLLKSQLIALWEFPGMKLVAFPLLLLTFSFYFNFWHFNYSASFCVPLWADPVRDSLASWTHTSISFLRLGKLSAIITLNVFPTPFSLFFWDPSKVNVCMLDVIPEVS